MEVLQSRVDSFAKSKRVKGSSKSSKVTVRWPHPPTFKASPEALAEAGFFYNPSVDDKDSVTCFECGKQLSEWEETDDPFDLHWTKCGDRCSWAVVRCGLRGDMDRHGKFVFPDKTRLPGSKMMEKARLGTFAVSDGWVHDQSKNHGANSRKMAQAGFVWTPQEPGDDLAACLYCNISLSGWEKDDDPMEEHRRRIKPGTLCPFFSYNTTSSIVQTPSIASATSDATTSSTTRRLTRSTSAKPPSRAQSKPLSRSVSSSRLPNKDAIQPVKDYDGSGEDDELDNFKRKDDEDDLSDAGPTAKPVKKPTATGKTRKGSRAPSARASTRSSTRSKSQPAPKSQHTRKKSQVRGNVLKDVEEEEEAAEETAGPPSGHVSEEERPAPMRVRGKVLKDVEEEEEESAEESVIQGDIPQPPEEIRIQDKIRKTSIQKKTPPPNELFSLNFDNTPIPEKQHVPSPKVPFPGPTVKMAEPEILPSPGPRAMTSEPEIPPVLPGPTVKTPEPVILPAPAAKMPKPEDFPVLPGPTATMPEPETLPVLPDPPEPEIFLPAPAKTPEPEIFPVLPGPTAKMPKPGPTVKTPEPEILPALSRVPFIPLQTLTEAELDMTVEEWIRYQMEIEFDKLKRDGERELARFKARAEEVRKMIEGL